MKPVKRTHPTDLSPKQLCDFIEGMNDHAERVLSERRKRAGKQQPGMWRGKPNPYTVTGRPQKPRFEDY